jgi:hypothetical protein
MIPSSDRPDFSRFRRSIIGFALSDKEKPFFTAYYAVIFHPGGSEPQAGFLRTFFSLFR